MFTQLTPYAIFLGKHVLGLVYAKRNCRLMHCTHLLDVRYKKRKSRYIGMSGLCNSCMWSGSGRNEHMFCLLTATSRGKCKSVGAVCRSTGYWGYMGIMKKKMETTIMGYIGYILGLLWGIIGITEKKMETTIVYWGNIGVQILHSGVWGLHAEVTSHACTTPSIGEETAFVLPIGSKTRSTKDLAPTVSQAQR